VKRAAALAAFLALGSALPAAADLAEVKQRGALRVLAVLASKTGDEFFNQNAGASPGFDRARSRRP
jgi:hypothetical protein